MKQTVISAAFFILANPLISMHAPHSGYSKLPADAKREIQKLVLEKIKERVLVDKTYNPDSLEFDGPAQDVIPTSIIKSNCWNILESGCCPYLWHKNGSHIALTSPGRFWHNNTRLTISADRLDPASIQTDGPNTTQDVLVAGQWYNTIHYHLQTIPTSHDKTVQKFGPGLISNQRLVAMALAAKRAFAIVGREKRGQHILSWYRYNDLQQVQLRNRSMLPGHLSQIAFVTPNVILGLTKNQQLVTLWINTKGQLKSQIHKTPFKIEKFALDSQNPDFIAFSYYGIEQVPTMHYSFGPMHPPVTVLERKEFFTLAISSLKNRDQAGKCIFKTKKIPITSQKYSLELANGVVKIVHGNETTYWKVPATIFSTFLAKKN